MLSALLSGERYAVGSATDGAEALSTIDEGHPDIVLADVWMPLMSGYELVDRMIGRVDRIPVILMRGILPEFRFPRKPVGIADVVDAVRQALGEQHT